jgi:hypothetical protein
MLHLGSTYKVIAGGSSRSRSELRRGRGEEKQRGRQEERSSPDVAQHDCGKQLTTRGVRLSHRGKAKRAKRLNSQSYSLMFRWPLDGLMREKSRVSQGDPYQCVRGRSERKYNNAMG